MKSTASLRRRILSRQARLGVIGQGYVGLSLACSAADADFNVTGIDVDAGRIDDLRRGVLSIPGVDEASFRSAIAAGRMEFTTDFSALAESEVICICVPTPLRDETPDLTYVESACRAVGEHLAPGRLVILESTTYPGTTEVLVRSILEASSGLVAGTDFLLAYSPERIDPGNQEFELKAIPRVVSGTSPEGTGMVALFYEQLVDKVVVVSSCRAAELAKLLENTFRHVNIALVNEMTMICHETGVDIWEVIDAASSKPFGFMPFYPGPGVGGHCIPLDPTYLAWQVRRDAGMQFRILEQSQDVNTRMPAYVASRIGELLNEGGRSVKGANILVLGVTYKPETGDIRESPSLKVMSHLHRKGGKVAFHDPYVDSVQINGAVLERVDLTERLVDRADCVALLTPHRTYDLDWIARRAVTVFDARNAYGSDRRSNVVRL